MAKNKTGLYIGLGVLGIGAIYLLTRKTTPAVTTPQIAPTASSSPSNLLSQGSSIVTAISKLFGGGSSSPAPGTAAAFAPVSIAPTGSQPISSVSPANQINFINPSAPPLDITAPAAPADESANFSDFGLDFSA
jgi:hypothetical protein